MSHPITPHAPQRRTPTVVLRVVLLATILALTAGAPALAAPQGAQLSDFSIAIQDTVQSVLPAVVQIVTSGYAPLQSGGRDLLSRTQGGGSGVIVDPNGYILVFGHPLGGTGSGGTAGQ